MLPEYESADLAYLLPVEKHGFRFHDLRHTCATLPTAADAHRRRSRAPGPQGHSDQFNVHGRMLPQAQER